MYLLHCQSSALNRPLLFSAKPLPISVPPFLKISPSFFSVKQRQHNYILRYPIVGSLYLKKKIPFDCPKCLHVTSELNIQPTTMY